MRRHLITALTLLALGLAPGRVDAGAPRAADTARPKPPPVRPASSETAPRPVGAVRAALVPSRRSAPPIARKAWRDGAKSEGPLVDLYKGPSVPLGHDFEAHVAPERIPTHTRGLMQRFHERRTALDHVPTRSGTYAVVIAARNEEVSIEKTLETAVSNMPKGGELILVVNGTTDRTAAIARAWLTKNKGRAQVTLKDLETGGKLRALTAVEPMFVERGWLPEHVVQLDADSSMPRESFEKLLTTARSGYDAVGAKLQFELPPHEADKPLLMGYEVSNRIHGTPGAQCLAGGASLSNTRDFLAAHGAMLERYPQAAGEDALYTAMLRFSGRRTTVDVGAPVQTLGGTNQELYRKQAQRWIRGSIQLDHFFGDFLPDLGLASHSIRPGSGEPRRLLRFGGKFFAEGKPGSRDLIERSGRMRELYEHGRWAREMRQRIQDDPTMYAEAIGEEYAWIPGRTEAAPSKPKP